MLMAPHKWTIIIVVIIIIIIIIIINYYHKNSQTVEHKQEVRAPWSP